MKARRRRRDRQAPILVLSSGHRCGSTLVQRAVGSHPDVLIWGEHGGAVQQILAAVDHLDWWAGDHGARGVAELERAGHHGWIANATPEPAVFLDAAREFLLSTFADPARARGCRRWGFKEVRYGSAAARTMRRLFEGTVVVHVTRDPRDVLRSLTRLAADGKWEPDAIPDTVAFWQRINAELFELRDEPWVLSVRFEDVVADPEGFISRLAALTGLDDRFDRGVFGQRVAWIGEVAPSDGELPPDLLAALHQPEFVRVAARYGYELTA